MKKKEIRVLNESGIHNRPSAMIVQVAQKFKSKMVLRKGEVEAKCDDIMDIMMLAAEYGTNLEIIADGEDEEKAINAIEALFLNKFYE